MPDKVDYNFISAREGGSKTVGYVPAASASVSGVTIATGFDLGARNENDLRKLNLSAVIVTKLKPYLGLKGIAAQNLLKTKPLILSATECNYIDKEVISNSIKSLVNAYDAALKPKHIKFYQLPTEAQTAIASVAYQYGNLNIKTPKFWKEVVDQDWGSAVKTLNNFGDLYPSRRKLEAQLLNKIVVKAVP
jgi:hypothetical protein